MRKGGLVNRMDSHERSGKVKSVKSNIRSMRTTLPRRVAAALFAKAKRPLVVAALLCVIVESLFHSDIRAATVTNCTEAALRAALGDGGAVTFACDGTITLANTITITTNVVLDGSGRTVTISGGNAVRVIDVSTGVTVTVLNLTIAHGRDTNGAGIFNGGGTVNLRGVVLSNNVAQGQMIAGGSARSKAEGGAICNSVGVVNATNCVFVGNVAQGNTNLQDGTIIGSGASGGAIFNVGEMNVAGCLFANNTAVGTQYGTNGPSGSNGQAGFDGRGGAIYSSDLLLVSTSTFTANSARGGRGGNGAPGLSGAIGSAGGVGGSGGGGLGGAIFNVGQAVINGSSLYGNGAGGGVGGDGGLGGSYFSQDGYFGGKGGSGGQASGGAICQAWGTFVITACTFASNSVNGSNGGGGGLGGFGGFSPGPGGSGGSGGEAVGAGLSAQSGRVELANNTFAGNAASGGGGGGGNFGGSCAPAGNGGNGGNGIGGALYNWTAIVTSTNNTYASNRVAGGIAARGAPGRFCGAGVAPGGAGGLDGNGRGGGLANISGSLSAVNCVLAFNSPGGDGFGYIQDSGFNVSSDPSCAFTNSGSLNDTDSMLGPLADNGGTTRTMALLPGSPAIDHGNDAFCPVSDQRGMPRPMGFSCDAGAYEVTQPSLIILDEALLHASVSTGGNIILNRDGVFVLTRSLVISRDTVLDGSAYNVAIHGRNGMRVFHVNSGVSFVMIGVTVTGGRSTNGGGIYNGGGVVTLLNCTFSNNVSVGLAGTPGIHGTNGPTQTGVPGGNGTSGGLGFDAQGGAIYNAGEIRATNCIFVSNRTQGGAGGYGGNGGGGSSVVDDRYRCVFGGKGGDGGTAGVGGRAWGGVLYNVGQAQFHQCAFNANYALGGVGGKGGSAGAGGCGAYGAIAARGAAGGSSEGGALCNLGTLAIFNCSLWGNESRGGSGGAGGGYYSGGSTPGTGGGGGNASGGAMRNYGSNSMINVTISLNSASGGDGGFGGKEVSYNCGFTFSGNGGGAQAGALANSGDVSALNCTIWQNAASGGTATNGCPSSPTGTNGTALGYSIVRLDGIVCLTNTIVGHGTAISNCLGLITDGGHNISSDGSCNFTTAGSLNNADPRLASLADNGGPTPTLALLPGSPAIDAGDSAACTPYDQRGVARPVGAACDIGAFEAPSPLAGQALRFDGMDDVVNIPHADVLNAYPITLTAWVRTRTLAPFAGIVNKYISSSGNGYQIWSFHGALRAWYFRDSDNYVFYPGDGLVAGAINDGLWHHCAFTVDASGGKLYLDGRLNDAHPWTGTPGPATTTTPLRLGYYYDYFDGEIDEVRIWNLALSAAEIQQGMFTRARGTEPGLLAYYRFDEGAGLSLADLTGHGFDGALMNGPQWNASTAPLLDIAPVTHLVDGRLRIQFTGLPGARYVLQAAADLGNWINVRTNAAASTGVVQFEDTPSAPHRFYRTALP